MKTLLFSLAVLLLSLTTSPVTAQWIPCEGLDGAYVNDLLVKDSLLFICPRDNGIFVRPVTGGPWEQLLSGISFLQIVNVENTLFARDLYYLYRSMNNGITWVNMDSLWGTNPSYYSLSVLDSHLFFSSYDAVFCSDDFGLTYQTISSGLPQMDHPLVFSNDQVLFVVDQTINPSIFRSYDYGQNWEDITSFSLPSSSFYPVYVYELNDTVWLSTTKGIFWFANSQESWTLNDSTIFFSKMGIMGNDLFGSSYEYGLFNFVPSSHQWIQDTSGLETNCILSFAEGGGFQFAGSNLGPFRRPQSNAWSSFYDGLYQSEVSFLSCLGDDVWVRTQKGLLSSSNNGESFSTVQISGAPIPKQLIMTDSVFYMIAKDSCYISFDHGINWTKQNGGLPYTNQSPFLGIVNLSINNQFLFLATTFGIFRASHAEKIWSKLDSFPGDHMKGITVFAFDSVLFVNKKIYTNNYYYYYSFRSLNNGFSFDSILQENLDYSTEFTGDSSWIYALDRWSLFDTENLGNSWIEIPRESFYAVGMDAQFPVIVLSGSLWEMTLYDTYLSMTLDKGMTWTDIRDNLPPLGSPVMGPPKINNHRLFASLRGNGLWYRDDLITGTGETIKTNSDRLVLFPNPAGDFVTLKIPGIKEKEAVVEIRDITGKRIKKLIARTKDDSVFQSGLYVGDLKPGLYLIYVRTDTFFGSTKVIIVR